MLEKEGVSKRMSDHIFISYRRDDAAYVTGHINDLLREEFGDESVFTDVDNIALGVDFRKVLDESVSQCSVFLAVVGDHWLTVSGQDGKPRLNDPADFVRIEIESALRRNIPIIPLLVGHATMPQAEDLPESLRDFAFRNGTPIRPPPDFNADVDRLIRSLRRYLESGGQDAGNAIEVPKEAVSSPAVKPERRKSPREQMLVGEDERARKRAELGLTDGAPKKRWGLRVALVAIAALAGASWYYADQNPEQVQSIMTQITGAQSTEPADRTPAGEPAEEPAEEQVMVVGAPTSFGAVANDTTEAAPDDADLADAQPPDDADLADAQPAEAEGIDVNEAVAVAEPGGDSEPVAEPVSDAATPDAATEPADEVILTPGTRRQADAAEFIREGVSLAATGDHEGAIQYFDRVIELDVEPAFAYRQRGASHQALGQFEAAVSDYDEAIGRNSEDLIAHYNRGVSHLALEDYPAAVLDFDAVIQLDPEYADAYTRRADAHEALGNAAQAAQDRATAGVFESNRSDPR